ncbi:MAG: AI-2E family transporter [Bacteroidota bacterium]
MSLKFPAYAKTSFVLLSLCIIIVFLYIGQQVFIPILLSLLFAILLRPVVNFLNTKLRFPHVIAVLVTVFLFIIFILGIIFFVSWQISNMADDWNQIKQNLSAHYENIQEWVKQKFRISYNNQNKYIEKATQDSLNNNKEVVGNTLSSFTAFVLNVVLIPVYTFLLLLYRTLFIKFLFKVVQTEQYKNVELILVQVKMAIHSYLVGVILEMGIVATLTSIGLMIIGIKYALLFGVITGILNLIPYVGILFAAFLTIIGTLTTSTDLSSIIGVVIVNSIVQLIDNNLLIPLVVSSKVRINAIVSIIGIIIGGEIAGVAGMFLAIPIIAILKVIFDHVESFKPWGYVMGDDLPKTYKWRRLKLPSFHAGHNSTSKEN